MPNPTPLQMLLDSLSQLSPRAELWVAFAVAVVGCAVSSGAQNWYRGNAVLPCARTGALIGVVFGFSAVLTLQLVQG